RSAAFTIHFLAFQISRLRGGHDESAHEAMPGGVPIELTCAFFSGILSIRRFLIRLIMEIPLDPGPAASSQEGEFVALNGGPNFKFTEAISFVVNSQTQDERDHYWEKLSAGGAEVQCGWLKDRADHFAAITERPRPAEIATRHESDHD